MHAPRGYQQTAISAAISFWTGGGQNYLIVLPTGAGKSYVLARIAALAGVAVCAIAHRGELVTQISVALAREGVRHRVIGPTSLARRCTIAHLEEMNRDFVQPNSRIAVAGVDTLVKMDPNDPWLASVGLWIQDEAHHLLADNKWGKASALFKNARGLGVTATPIRADGKGLGRHADGLIDEMFVGPTMRELINQKFLTDYRIFAPPSDLDLSTVGTSANGDYSPPELSAARKRSHITGDVVQHYLRIARGKLGVTFDVDIESATDTAAAFNAAGIPAAVVTGKTPDAVRADTLRRFKRRELLQLVNVDLFGEGFDLPAIEVVSFARPTQSFALFAQQFGRSLRILDGKQWAIIIDHVGNTLRHGLPDAARVWSLDRRERRSKSLSSDVIPTRTCLNAECMGVYERVHSACPYCGAVAIPQSRGTPEQVDGDLHELDPIVLAHMRGEISRIDSVPQYPTGAGPAVRGAIARTHWERQQGQSALRHTIAVWSGWQHALGRDDPESYKRFFFKFGIDVASAQALNATDAAALTERVAAELQKHNVQGLT